MSDFDRADRNERFLQRLLARRPQDREYYEQLLAAPPAAPAARRAPLPRDEESGVRPAEARRAWALETIVKDERPVLFVQNDGFNTTEVTTIGREAAALVAKMRDASQKLLPLLPLIGRFDVKNFPNIDFIGSGWFVDTHIVVTNRHVAELIARHEAGRFVFRRGIGGQPMEGSICTGHEYDDLTPDADRVFAVREVLYIEPDSGPHDIAFVRVARGVTGNQPRFIPLAERDLDATTELCVIGYPARAPRSIIPDQALMHDLYLGKYDVKRAAPGYGIATRHGASEHDCTTLGGNSGSVVLDFEGRAVGLHFAGLYRQANFAVPASVLRNYIAGQVWTQQVHELRPRPQAPPAAAAAPIAPAGAQVATGGGGQVVVTIPLTISLALGAPAAPTGDAISGDAHSGDAAVTPAVVESTLAAYWDSRPRGVLAARVGYFDEGERIGERPCLAASVAPADLPAFEAQGPREFRGVPIRYLPASAEEQLDALPGLEAAARIAYDDDARAGDAFSFAPVDEEMEVTLHVGPEYSWDQLEQFLAATEGQLVAGMYEFHATHIKDALQRRLADGAALTLVVDSVTFGHFNPSRGEFDRDATFEGWEEQFDFEYIVAPEGTQGLIANSYHIKVAVRDDDTFWLSSGNWKPGSSQPIITQAQRDEALTDDLPGNREWHVIARSPTLARRFRAHLRQDFARSQQLQGGPESAAAEQFVDIALDESPILERRAPRALVEPLNFRRRVAVRPLATPDREGAVYCEAVLELIRSARTSLLFQIPYIGMPSNPRRDRGFIDDLIRALTEKLKTLRDARLLLRSGGSEFSSPAHAAWYFKSKGVDIDNRVRTIENHHTKGMIVDGRRVLVGSHNWSQSGVTLNRDASLLFDDAEAAGYFARAFEIDWARANPVRARQFRRSEAVVREAHGDQPPPGFRRISLAELLKDD